MVPGGVYLLTGPDRARKLQRIQALERTLGIHPLDRHHVDASGLPAAELVALCRQQPAASPVRLIVVEQAHRLDGAAAEALRHHAAVIAKSACLVLLVETELTARHALARLLPGRGAGRESGPVVVEEFPERNAPSAKPFALTDALGTRDVGAALVAVQDQLAAGKEPLELLGLVAWQLNRWVTVRRLRDAGYTSAQIASATGFRPWQIERMQTEVARRSVDSLRGTLERCWQLDVDAKRGRHVPELALQQLILEVCLAAERTA